MGAEARTQPRLLGHRPRRRGGRRGRAGRRGAGYESVWAAESYGSDVVSVLAWLAAQTETINLGAAILQVPGAPARGGGDGRGDDRQALRRPLPLRLRPLGPAGLRGLVRRPLREALGPHPRVHRSRARDHRPRGPGRPPGRALHAAAARRRGQAAEAQLPPAAQRDPGLRRRDRAQIGRDGGRDLRRLDPDLLQRRRLRGRPGASTWRPASPRAAASAPTSRSRPRCRSRSTATWRRRRASSRPASSSTSAAWAAARPTSTSTSPTASASARSPTRSSSRFQDGDRGGAFEAMPDEIVEATSLVGTEAEVAERVERFRGAGIDRLIVSPVHVERDQQLHTLERLAVDGGRRDTRLTRCHSLPRRDDEDRSSERDRRGGAPGRAGPRRGQIAEEEREASTSSSSRGAGEAAGHPDSALRGGRAPRSATPTPPGAPTSSSTSPSRAPRRSAGSTRSQVLIGHLAR